MWLPTTYIIAKTVQARTSQRLSQASPMPTRCLRMGASGKACSPTVQSLLARLKVCQAKKNSMLWLANLSMCQTQPIEPRLKKCFLKYTESRNTLQSDAEPPAIEPGFLFVHISPPDKRRTKPDKRFVKVCKKRLKTNVPLGQSAGQNRTRRNLRPRTDKLPL